MTPFGWGLLVAGSVTGLGVVTAVVLARAWLDLVAERDAYRRLLGVTASERDEGDAVARAALDLLEARHLPVAVADLGVAEDYARPGQLLLLRLKRFLDDVDAGRKRAGQVEHDLRTSLNAAENTISQELRRFERLKAELADVRRQLDAYRTAPTGEEFSPAEVLERWAVYHAQMGPIVNAFHDMARAARQVVQTADRARAQAPSVPVTY